jgi:hypothetical protein
LKDHDIAEHKATYWAITDDAERLMGTADTNERPPCSTSNSVQKTRVPGANTHSNVEDEQ